MAKRRNLMGQAVSPRRADPGRPKAIGCYIFAGGFTVGVSKHFDVVASLEGADGYGADVTQANFPSLPIHKEPWPLDELVEKHMGIDFMYGNPPCAAWSGNNPKSHIPGAWREDERLECTLKFFSLLEKLRPKVWACESVTQAPEKGREFYDELIVRAARLGYSCTEFFHDVKWHGTPQTRKRWIIMFHRVGLSLPAPNWAPPQTAVEALEGIEMRGPEAFDHASSWALRKHFKKLPPGMRLRKFWETLNPDESKREINPATGFTRGRPAFGHVRLHTDRPASATVGYGMVHPTEHRFLSVNEVAVIAGFPDGYKLPETKRGERSLDYIARGVCPPLAAYLAGAVKAAIAADLPVGEPVVRVVDYREPPAALEGDQVVTYAIGEPRPAKHKPAAVEKQRRLPRSEPLQGEPAKPRPKALPKLEKGEGSGAYARRLIALEAYTSGEIVEAIKERFPGSKASGADVSFYRAEARKAGLPARVVRETTAGRRLVPEKDRVP